MVFVTKIVFEIFSLVLRIGIKYYDMFIEIWKSQSTPFNVQY